MVAFGKKLRETQIQEWHEYVCLTFYFYFDLEFANIKFQKLFNILMLFSIYESVEV